MVLYVFRGQRIDVVGGLRMKKGVGSHNPASGGQHSLSSELIECLFQVFVLLQKHTSSVPLWLLMPTNSALFLHPLDYLEAPSQLFDYPECNRLEGKDTEGAGAEKGRYLTSLAATLCSFLPDK